MALTPEQAERLRLPHYPRAAAHDPHWVLEHLDGPERALWLTEALTQVLDLRPGMRVLDMGCGMALSSIFLAKEFGVQVWANDLRCRLRELGADPGRRSRRSRLPDPRRSPRPALRGCILRRRREPRCLPLLRHRRSLSRRLLEVHPTRRRDRDRGARAARGVYRGRTRAPRPALAMGVGSFTARPGGADAGSAPGTFRCRAPTRCPTAGANGSCGWRFVATPGTGTGPMTWACSRRPGPTLRVHAGGPTSGFRADLS